MKAFIEGKIVAVEDATFKDAKSGSDVPYFLHHVQGEDGSLVTIGTRDSHMDMVGKESVITVNVRPSTKNNREFRVQLIDVKPV